MCTRIGHPQTRLDNAQAANIRAASASRSGARRRPPPQDWPLAVIDARTVGADEGVPYPMVIVDKIPETLPMVPQPSHFVEGANFCYNPEHQWCYSRDIEIDEVLVFTSL